MRNSAIIRFLIESNAIEDVWDLPSLKQALKAWDYIIEERILTLDNIQKTHQILMKGKLPHHQVGAWRKVGVWIAGRPGRAWHAIPRLMERWIARANDGYSGERTMHIDFERIHPFVDGNGRVGRILLNWMRVRRGKNPLIIEEKEKARYYAWFDEQDPNIEYPNDRGSIAGEDQASMPVGQLNTLRHFEQEFDLTPTMPTIQHSIQLSEAQNEAFNASVRDTDNMAAIATDNTELQTIPSSYSRIYNTLRDLDID